MVGLTSDITHRKHEISGDPAFYRQAPLLAGRCEQDRIDTAWAVYRTGWRRRRPERTARGRQYGIPLKRNERKRRTIYLLARVIRRIGVGSVREVILEIIVDSKAGAHRPGSLAARIPCDAHARLQ